MKPVRPTRLARPVRRVARVQAAGHTWWKKSLSPHLRSPLLVHLLVHHLVHPHHHEVHPHGPSAAIHGP